MGLDEVIEPEVGVTYEGSGDRFTVTRAEDGCFWAIRHSDGEEMVGYGPGWPAHTYSRSETQDGAALVNAFSWGRKAERSRIDIAIEDVETLATVGDEWPTLWEAMKAIISGEEIVTVEFLNNAVVSASTRALPPNGEGE